MKTKLRLLTLALTLAAALPVVAELPPPPAVPFPNNLLPPPMGVFVGPVGAVDRNGDGIINYPGTAVRVSHVRLELPDHSMPPPAPGGTQVQSFAMTVRMDLSMGPVSPTQHITAQALVTMRGIVGAGAGAPPHIGTEMLQLDISGGDLPAGMKVRESPAMSSSGNTVIVANGDGTFLISSFFDVFTELSTDGGQTWMPADTSERLSLIAPSGLNTFVTPDLPPAAPLKADRTLVYEGSLVIRDSVVLVNPGQSVPPPPPGGTFTLTFQGIMALDLSMDGGLTFMPCRAPCTMTERIASYLDYETTRFFDTEMLALDISGGTLPPGVMIRESPTKQSLGRTSIHTVRDGPEDTYRIGSFFDIFTELSVNGGNTWMPCVSGACTFALPAVPMHAEFLSKGGIAPSAGVLNSGVPPDAILTFVGLPCINARGDEAVLVKWGSKSMGNGSGIALHTSLLTGATIYEATFLGAVYVGSSVTSGGNVGIGTLAIASFIGDPVLGEDGTLLFMATLLETSAGAPPSKSTGVVQFGMGDGSVQLVAQAGMPVPGVPGGLWGKFSSMTACGDGSVLVQGFLVQDGVNFTAPNDNVLCFFDKTGYGQLVFREGKTMIGAKTVKIIGGLTARSRTPGARASNDMELVTKITFTDGSFAAVHTAFNQGHPANDTR